ncbi:MAG TPA: DoxX family protein [Chitinophagales bacterium]|nr:DoxX family protein [Chitinophagales bacterium]
MNTILWVLQGLLAVMFSMAGIMKATQPVEKLSEKMPWVKDYSAFMVRFVGVAELLGGIGLVVPWLTGIMPVLTPVAAVALCLVMVLAAIYHARHNEWKAISFNFVLFAIAAFIAYGRF